MRSDAERFEAPMPTSLCVLAIALAIVLPGCSSHSSPDRSAADAELEYATPEGVTLVSVEPARGKVVAAEGQQPASQAVAAGASGILLPRPARLGGAHGEPLYYLDDKVECDTDCRAGFVPFEVSHELKGSRLWSMVPMPEGARQWAFNGHPLFRRDDGAEGPVPDAWKLALFDADVGLDLPPAVRLWEARVIGWVLATEQGRTLYRLKSSFSQWEEQCDRRCQQNWLPLPAAALAHSNAKDFSIVARPDGSRQWAYRGDPLFSYAGDLLPGDVSAIDSLQGRLWQTAVVYQLRRPNGITVRDDVEQGPIWTTADNRPLYTRHRHDSGDTDFGGRQLARAFRQPYATGKLIGTLGCDAECLKVWTPFSAPDDAVALGYWEPIRRPDGSLQWSYKGYALYTYAHDVPGKSVTGTNLYDLDRGDSGRYKVSEVPTIRDRKSFRQGAYLWHVAVPDL